MPEGGDVLKEFMVGVGFKVDPSSLRTFQEGLKNAEAQVNRFARAVDNGTKLVAKSFQEFQRAEAPRRRHIESTKQLAQGYEDLSRGLKRFIDIIVGGAIVNALTSLTKQFESLYYAARYAGTTVKGLEAIQFGFQRAGESGAEATAALQGMRRALETMPGLAQWAQQFGFDIIDPTTGKLKDMSVAIQAVMTRLRELYKSGPAGAALAKQLAEMLNIPWTQSFEAILKFDDLFKDVMDGYQRWLELQRRSGVNVDKFAEQSRGLMNALREVYAVVELLAVRLAGPWVEPATKALKFLEDELLQLFQWLDKLSKETGGVSDYVAGLGAAFVTAAGGVTALRIAVGLLISPLRTIGAIATGVTSTLTGLAGLIARLSPVLAFLYTMRPIEANKGEPQRPVTPQDMPATPGPGTPRGPEQAPKTWADVWEALKRLPGQAATGNVGDLAHRRRHGDIFGLPGGGAQHPLSTSLQKFQQGGVVPIMAHAGEVVLGADLVRMMSDWLRGGGGFRPLVHVDNPEDFTDAFGKDLTAASREAGVHLRRHGDPFGLSAPRSAAPGIGGGSKFGGAYNWGHIMYGTYKSAEQGVQAVAQWMTRNFDRGLHTLTQLISRYAPPSENPTGTLIARAARHLGVDPNTQLNLRDPEIMRKLVSATIMNEYGWRLPRGLSQETIDRALGTGGPPLGTTNNYRAGDRTVTINAQRTFNVNGADALSIGGAINSATERTNADLVRNLTPIVQ